MLIFIIILVILFISYVNKTEQFVNYKAITVSPNKTIYDGIVLNIPANNIFYYKLGEKMKSIYPIKYINYDETLSIIKNIEMNRNYIGVVPEVMKIIKPNNFKNTRFISSIGLERFTLFSPSYNNITDWEQTNNKKIGVITNSAAFHTLTYIKTMFSLSFKIISIKLFDESIIKDFKKRRFHAFFMIIAHPNNVLSKIHKDQPLNFIGTKGMGENAINIAFPNLLKAKIDLTHYNIYNSQPDTLLVKLNLVTNKNFSKDNGYNLIQTIFKNLLSIKSSGSDTYKMQMRDFNPEYIYLSNNNQKLHKGAYKFYKDIGLITNNPERSCRYKVGIGECNIKKINHFRLL